MFGVGGFSFAGSGPNQGILFCMLKDFNERPGEQHSAKAVVGQLFGEFSEITGAMVIPFLPPSINGLGKFGGFQYELLDQSGGPIEDLAAAARSLSAQANQTPGLTGVFTQFTANDPQLVVTIDREQAKSLGIVAQRHHADDADSARVVVRERLRLQQPVVSRLRAGRQPVPLESRATSSATPCGTAPAR